MFVCFFSSGQMAFRSVTSRSHARHGHARALTLRMRKHTKFGLMGGANNTIHNVTCLLKKVGRVHRYAMELVERFVRFLGILCASLLLLGKSMLRKWQNIVDIANHYKFL